MATRKPKVTPVVVETIPTTQTQEARTMNAGAKATILAPVTSVGPKYAIATQRGTRTFIRLPEGHNVTTGNTIYAEGRLGAASGTKQVTDTKKVDWVSLTLTPTFYTVLTLTTDFGKSPTILPNHLDTVGGTRTFCRQEAHEVDVVLKDFFLKVEVQGTYRHTQFTTQETGEVKERDYLDVVTEYADGRAAVASYALWGMKTTPSPMTTIAVTGTPSAYKTEGGVHAFHSSWRLD